MPPFLRWRSLTVYSLLVSHQFQDWDGEAFRFDKSRFLEYTSEPIEEQLRPLSIEAIECIKSWPCVLMEEGRADELVRIARISELRDLGKEIRLTVDLFLSQAPILNDHLWRIRGARHRAVRVQPKPLGSKGAGSILSPSRRRPRVRNLPISLFEARPLPAPPRASLIEARNSIAEWSHTQIDDLLLEAGVEGLSARRDVGSRRDRANAIVQFAIENPSLVTAENSLFSAYLVRRASPTEEEAEAATPPAPTQEVAPATGAAKEAESVDRSPNRVFVVHGQNDTARSAVVSFLETIGLVGIVLHEQPNMGRHLLTKFIQEAELVTFAVVLMTDDDVGSLKDGKHRGLVRT